MADMVRCSTRTIQAIELGQLRLSESLGERIAFETGVDLGWLMMNDTSTPIIGDMEYGDTYTKEEYEQHRANISGVFTIDGEVELGTTMWRAKGMIGQLLGLYVDATYKRKLKLFDWKVSKALDDIEQELGLSVPVKLQVEYVGKLQTGYGVDTKTFNVTKITQAFWAELKKAWKEQPKPLRASPKTKPRPASRSKA
jgi:hypothetical protein